jgi:hypothetical protein
MSKVKSAAAGSYKLPVSQKKDGENTKSELNADSITSAYLNESSQRKILGKNRSKQKVTSLSKLITPEIGETTTSVTKQKTINDKVRNYKNYFLNEERDGDYKLQITKKNRLGEQQKIITGERAKRKMDRIKNRTIKYVQSKGGSSR